MLSSTGAGGNGTSSAEVGGYSSAAAEQAQRSALAVSEMPPLGELVLRSFWWAASGAGAAIQVHVGSSLRWQV